MIFATLEFTIMQSLIKHVSGSIHPFELAFFRIFFGVLTLVPIAIKTKMPKLNRKKLGLYLSRSAISSVSMSLTFLGISLIPLAEATALRSSAPIFSSIIAIHILKEASTRDKWIAMGLGFLGTLVIIRPGFDIISPGALIMLSSSVIVAWVVILIKILSKTESTLSITLYTGLFQVPIILLFALPFWTWPQSGDWLWLISIGVIGALGQMFMTQAYKVSEVTTILPFNFCKLIWASIIGYFVFAEIPDIWTWIGGIMIFASGTYIAFREAKSKRRNIVAQTIDEAIMIKTESSTGIQGEVVNNSHTVARQAGANK